MEQEITLTQENQTALKTLLPSLRNSTGNLNGNFLVKSPETAIEAIRSNKNQISGLVKEAGAIHVDALILVLLNEVFSLTNSPINNLATMAVMIRKNFYMLRFEEIVFAFNKGINGGYGKLFGHLSYPQISEWLNSYIDIDRAAAVDYRNAEKQGEGKENLKGWQLDVSEVLKKYAVSPEDLKRTDAPDLSSKAYDEKILKDLMSENGELNLKCTLTELMDFCEKNNYTKSLEYLKEKLKLSKDGK